MKYMSAILGFPRITMLMLLSLMVLVPMHASGQTAQDPRPEETPFFHDADGQFNEEQLKTLKRDAQLLQSTDIPTLVYVRSVTAAEANPESSQAFADEVRRSWDIESSDGSDDGLVLLFSWVPDNPAESTAVFSHGSGTFENSGLTPESIQETIDTSVRSLIEQQKPFEAVVYLIRETRYDGIYAPPPPPPLEGAASSLHSALPWLGPATAAFSAFTLAWLTARFWRVTPSTREVWRVVGMVLLAALILWLVSVYAQSGVGVVSALLILVALAISTWVWSRAGFVSASSPFVRHRSVPPTNRLMRKRHQARTMMTRVSGGKR